MHAPGGLHNSSAVYKCTIFSAGDGSLVSYVPLWPVAYPLFDNNFRLQTFTIFPAKKAYPDASDCSVLLCRGAIHALGYTLPVANRLITRLCTAYCQQAMHCLLLMGYALPITEQHTRSSYPPPCCYILHIWCRRVRSPTRINNQ